MAGQIGDLIMQMMGKQDPRDALMAALAGGGTPGAPVAAGATPDAGGTDPGTAAPAAPGAAPPPDQTPEAYKSPPQLMQLYSDLLKRQDINAGINRGVGLIGASLAQEKNRAGILDAFGVGSGGEMTGMSDPSALVNNMLAMRANQTAAATKAAQRASVPAIAKQLGIPDETALFLFDSGKLDQVVAEAQKPDNQIIQDAATGQSHIVNKKTGEIGPALDGAKPHELAIETDQNTGEKYTVDKVTGKRVGDPLNTGVRKTEYIEEPLTGTKKLVYSDTKEPVPDAEVLPGGGNTELQKNWNAAMRGIAPGDPGYMTLQQFSEAAKKSGGGFLSVGNGKVFDTSTGKFVTDPNDPANGADTSPDNAPILAPGEKDTEYLAKLPTDTQNLVKGLTDYTLDLTKVSSVKGDARQKLAAAAKRYDPSFDMTQYGARQKMRQSVTSGPIGQNITSLNTVIGHIGDLAKSGEALSNTSYPMWNTVKNAWESTAVGAPEQNNFEIAKQAVASEMAKVFRGAGSMSKSEIDEWKDTLSSAQSPAQMKGAIAKAVDLLSSRMDAVKTQYTATMSKPWDVPFLTPKSQKILKNLGIDPADMDPTAKGDADTDTTDASPDAPPSEEEIQALIKKHSGKK